MIHVLLTIRNDYQKLPVAAGLYVVDIALQFWTMVAGAGPGWTGLHPGNAGMSINKSSRDTPQMNGLTFSFNHLVYSSRLSTFINFVIWKHG